MKLLVITQKVDKNDEKLGFFHAWLEKFAAQVDHLYVICLEKGEYELPKNVTVLSLGKKEKKSRLTYLMRFYSYIFKYRKDYQGVFVHMNPEYAILGGAFWRLWHKKVSLWYTHKAVNWRLRLGVLFVNKIFTASKESFRLPSKKVEVMGHGIPIDNFVKEEENVIGNDLWLLTVGRIAPSKDLETIVKSIGELLHTKLVPPPRFTVAGRAFTQDEFDYKVKLQDLAATFKNDDGSPAIGFRTLRYKPDEMPSLYKRYQIFIHTSRTGSMDKVVLEALAAGRIVVTSSEAYRHLDGSGFVYWFPPGDYQELAKTIEKIYKAGILVPNQKAIEYVRKNHNLDVLIGKIMAYF